MAAFAPYGIGDSLVPVVTVGVDGQVVGVDDMRHMQERVQPDGQIHATMQGRETALMACEADDEMAFRLDCGLGSVDA
ncbi:hypothetical protein FMUBM48_14410 [Nocardia cyriacigeorgica]|nr:hypothetical protein FMUBM48_14410 [Nocardia cyriacigeorgica]